MVPERLALSLSLHAHGHADGAAGAAVTGAAAGGDNTDGGGGDVCSDGCAELLDTGEIDRVVRCVPRAQLRSAQFRRTSCCATCAVSRCGSMRQAKRRRHRVRAPWLAARCCRAKSQALGGTQPVVSVVHPEHVAADAWGRWRQVLALAVTATMALGMRSQIQRAARSGRGPCLRP